MLLYSEDSAFRRSDRQWCVFSFHLPLLSGSLSAFHPARHEYSVRPGNPDSALHTGQPEPSPFITFITEDLDLFKECRRFLHFVYKDKGLIHLKEEFRITFCQFPDIRIIQRNIGTPGILCQIFQHRRLADLSRSGHHDCFESAGTSLSDTVQKKQSNSSGFIR